MKNTKKYEEEVFIEYEKIIREIAKQNEVDLSVATSMFLTNIDFMSDVYKPMPAKFDYFKVQVKLKEIEKESEKFGL